MYLVLHLPVWRQPTRWMTEESGFGSQQRITICMFSAVSNECRDSSPAGKGTRALPFMQGKGKIVPMLNEAPLHEGVCGSGGIAPPFLTSALGGGDWSAPCCGRFTPGERAPVSAGEAVGVSTLCYADWCIPTLLSSMYGQDYELAGLCSHRLFTRKTSLLLQFM
jgi:hypothetical protein